MTLGTAELREHVGQAFGSPKQPHLCDVQTQGRHQPQSQEQMRPRKTQQTQPQVKEQFFVFINLWYLYGMSKAPSCIGDGFSGSNSMWAKTKEISKHEIGP